MGKRSRVRMPEPSHYNSVILKKDPTAEFPVTALVPVFPVTSVFSTSFKDKMFNQRINKKPTLVKAGVSKYSHGPNPSYHLIQRLVSIRERKGRVGYRNTHMRYDQTI